MAETTAAPDAAPAADVGTAASAAAKPLKPNQELFNEEVAKAEKEYKEAMTKYVSKYGLCT